MMMMLLFSFFIYSSLYVSGKWLAADQTFRKRDTYCCCTQTICFVWWFGFKYFCYVKQKRTWKFTYVQNTHSHTHAPTHSIPLFNHLNENTQSIDKIIVQCLHAGGRLEKFLVHMLSVFRVCIYTEYTSISTTSTTTTMTTIYISINYLYMFVCMYTYKWI